MEYKIIHGKKALSKVFHVISENELFVKKHEQNDTIYVKCYFSLCSVTAKIKNEKFYHSNHANHEGHSHSVSSLLLEWDFYDDLRKECAHSKKSLKSIFDDIYER